MEGLGISLNGLLAQIVNFLILLALLYFIAYKPLRRMMEERSNRIREGLEQAEQASKRLAEADEEAKKKLEEARREGQKLISQASALGERLKEEARQEAKAQAEALLARARGEIELERDQAIQQLRREFADLAMLAAEKVIRETLDEERHRRLINEVLEEAEGLKGK